VLFSDIPGWDADDHLAAFNAFVKSARAISRAERAASGKTKVANIALVAAARAAAENAAAISSPMRPRLSSKRLSFPIASSTGAPRGF
jgi:membrane-bound lytic murein transglycosylase A